MPWPDRRDDFKDAPWQQGKLLFTATTCRWDKKKRDEEDYVERCTAFVNFTSVDEGQSRQYVFRFSSPDECKAAVEQHNAQLYDKLGLDGLGGSSVRKEEK